MSSELMFPNLQDNRECGKQIRASAKSLEDRMDRLRNAICGLRITKNATRLEQSEFRRLVDNALA
jgi:hypothetical protein